MNDEIKQVLEDLAYSRMIAEAAKDAKKRLEEEFWARPENQEILEATSHAVEVLAECESKARRVIAEAYDPENGKKFDGYGYREVTRVTITNMQNAFQWCLKNFTPALAINTKIFERAAKEGNVPEHLASVETEIVVTIAQDLSAFVAVE